jgi:hypothetical protein
MLTASAVCDSLEAHTAVLGEDHEQRSIIKKHSR